MSLHCIDVIGFYLKGYLTDAQFEEIFDRHSAEFEPVLGEKLFWQMMSADFRSKEQRIHLQVCLRDFMLAVFPVEYETISDAYAENLIEAGQEDDLTAILKKRYEPKETVVIHCGEIESVTELHALLQKELGLGANYGRNWDALRDFLYDILFPEMLVFENWMTYQKKFPRDAAVLREILRNIPDDRCAVVYE